MTESEFTSYYPQFAGFTPAFVLSSCIAQANARFSAFTAEDAAVLEREEAIRLIPGTRNVLRSDEDAKTLCETICRALGAEPIQCIGRKIVIYRETPEDEK